MSRTNHYRLCRECTEEIPCELHVGLKEILLERHILVEFNLGAVGHHGLESFFLPREMPGRRPWKRRARYPRHSVKEYSSAPSRWWWQNQHSKARAIYRQMMQRSDDPA